MRLPLLTTFCLLFCKSVLTAQVSVPNPLKSDFERGGKRVKITKGHKTINRTGSMTRDVAKVCG